MAILATLFAFLGRQLQRILMTVLGWASTLLFGRVPADRQLVLVLVTFGSIAWVALAIGVLVPDAGTFLLGFVPVPDVVPEWLVRLVMLGAALVLPLVLGTATLALMPGDARPKGTAIVIQAVRGYPMAAFLALSLAVLAVIATWYKARAIVRRWETAHIPVIVRPGGYDRTVGELGDALDGAGLRTSTRDAPAALAVPARLLGGIAGNGIGGLVPERLAQLQAPKLEVIVYPTDVAITGAGEGVARARAAIATRLTAAPAYLTTTAETQAVEDRIERLGIGFRAGTLAIGEATRELEVIDVDLAALQVPYDEWEVLYRMRLHAERDLLRGAAPGLASPADAAALRATDVALRATDVTVLPGPRARPRPLEGDLQPIGTALGAIGIALVLLDALLLLWQRIEPRPPPARGDTGLTPGRPRDARDREGRRDQLCGAGVYSDVQESDGMTASGCGPGHG